MNSASRDLAELGPWYGQVPAIDQQPPRPNPHDRQFGAGELFRILKRRKWLIAATVGIILALTVVMLSRMTPQYTTASLLMVEPENPMQGVEGAAVIATPNDELRIATKLELLQSRALARQVAEDLDLRNDPEFAPDPAGEPSLIGRVAGAILPGRDADATTPAGPLEVENAAMETVTNRLLDHIEVERLGRSHLIRVTARSSDPAMASRIANRYLQTHIETQREEQRKAHEQEVAQLTERVELLRGDLREADGAVARYRASHGLLTARPDSLNETQMAQLSGTLVQLRAERAQNRSRSSFFANGGGATASSPLLTELRTQESTLGKRLAELSTAYGRNHPDVRSASAQLRDVENRIQAEIARVGSTLRNEAAISSAQEGQILADVGALRSESFREVGATTGLLDLERDADTSHALYVSLLGRLKELSGKDDVGRADSSIVSRAPIPLEPSFPAPKSTLSVAFLGSIALAFILALIAESRDNRLRNAEQVERWLAVPALTLIPEADRPEGMAAYELIYERPRSTFSESVRALLIELDALSPALGSHVIMVTSPLGGEGRRTVASSLAAVASTTGRSVVTVDLDLRKPGLVRDSETPPPADLTDFLAGKAELHDILSSDPAVAPFSTVGARHPARDPGALMASPRLPLLIAQLRERFELIILNTPPILPVRDAKLAARLADSTVLVLRWGSTSLEAARIAVEIFGGRITGAVVNRVDLRKHRGGGHGDALDHVRGYRDYYDSPPQIGGMPQLPRLSFGRRRGSNGDG